MTNVHVILPVLALLFGVGSLVPWTHNFYLLAVAALLLAVNALVP